MPSDVVKERPIAEGLFEVLHGEPVLVGSRCMECSTVAFPYQGTCPRCTSGRVELYRLATLGSLWTWTSQGFRPKSPPYVGPEEFSPYFVGYVELGGEIRVEGRLVVGDAKELQIGMAMRLVLISLPGTDCATCATFGFEPVRGLQ